MAQKGLWNVTREEMLQDRVALPQEEGDFARKYKAMHEDNFFSSWLREDVEGIEEVRQEESRSGKREVEREEEKSVVVKRPCVNPFSSDVF